MIAGEDDSLGGEAVLGGDLLDEAAEVLRGHARVAAILVDLVAGSLDQQRQLRGQRGAHRCLKHHGMRGADRGDPRRAGAVEPRRDVVQRVLRHVIILPTAQAGHRVRLG